MDLRETIREIFLGTLRHLELSALIPRHVHCSEGRLHIGETSFALHDFERVHMIAVGKAAVPMAHSLVAQLRPELRNQLLQGIVIGATLPVPAEAGLQYFQAGHPVPDRHSLEAADAVLGTLRTCGERCLVLFLISGGASSMLEKPLSSEITAEEMAEFHRVLVHSGLPIGAMNVLRKHFSAVKGGRLATAAGAATKCTLLISDVPPDALHVIGSGPTLPDPSSIEDCRALLQEHRAVLPFSERVLAFFSDPRLPETPKADAPEFLNSTWQALLSSADLCAAGADLAAGAGFHVEIDNTCDEWPSDAAAEYLLDRMEQLRSLHRRVCLLSAGEIAVNVGPGHGVGGRNQHFVLQCAGRLAHTRAPITVLSAGSDGIDGNSPAAGAVADENTVARAAHLGLDAEGALRRFDSYTLFQALADTVVTGPTGNNVRDLRILLSSR